MLLLRCADEDAYEYRHHCAKCWERRANRIEGVVVAELRRIWGQAA